MQSLASLMSMKQADIGNLDDFEEENEEDEENRVNQEEKAAKITGMSLFQVFPSLVPPKNRHGQFQELGSLFCINMSLKSKTSGYLWNRGVLL